MRDVARGGIAGRSGLRGTRIAYFTESLLPLVDGVSLTLSHLFDTLQAEGVDFRVYSAFRPEDGTVSWADRVRRLPSFAFPLYRDYRVGLPVGRGLVDDLDAFRPDLVHVVSPTPLAVWAQRFARRRGLPAVATFHTHFVAYFRYYGVRALERAGWAYLRWFYDRCAAVYAPSTSIIRELREHGIARVRLWSRGVDAERFSPAHRDPELRRRLGVSADVPLLLMVSRLVKEKDLLDLIEMHRVLARRGVAYRLGLVGDGPLRAELERALPDAIFAGHREDGELARWYASADAFVFPSTTETFGNVVLEALASGLPAVVVDRGGPKSVIRPGVDGLVARANEPVELADRVEPLLRDSARRRRMSRAARDGAIRREWGAVNRGLLEDYRRVLGEHSSIRARLAG